MVVVTEAYIHVFEQGTYLNQTTIQECKTAYLPGVVLKHVINAELLLLPIR